MRTKHYVQLYYISDSLTEAVVFCHLAFALRDLWQKSVPYPVDTLTPL